MNRAIGAVTGLATAQEQELVLGLRDRLLWRSGWDHWAELADAGSAPEPVEMFRQYREGPRRLVA